LDDDSKSDLGGASISPPAVQLIAGRYEVIGLLGVGGMGAVYKVKDRELDETVALKMMKREIAGTPGILERFRREVKLARRVTHPNVARTFDLGEHEGDRFLTMEMVEGESLATRVAREGALPLAAMIEIVTSICAGLEAAHAAGVVHRDLKPDNVLLGARRVVITDFGVARALDPGAAMRTAVPIGTPAYMAPEQVEASPNVDARADVYALGVMMFELLTRRLPFEADSVFAMAAMRLTQPPPDPRAFRADIPDAIARIVGACMARRPEDRPQRAGDIARELANVTLPAAALVIACAPAHSGGARANALPAETGASQKTVAVLPFRNAGKPDDDYLVDGLTDDLVDALSMAPGLRVRPRGVVMQHRDESRDPRTLGRALGVQVVVDGTVRTTDDKIRVSARVLSVEDGFQIWAKRFEGTRADVLHIGDDASRDIAAALSVARPTRAPLPTDPIAIDLYLRARQELFKFWAGANERAIELLEAAHQRAPDDAVIMAGYATALSRQHGAANAGPRHGTALRVAEAAVRAAPQLGEAHIALAGVKLHDPDPVACAASVMRALSLAPLLPEAHQLRARLLSEVGAPADAIAAAERAMQVEPRLLHLRYDVQARARAMMGEWDIDDYEPPKDTESHFLYGIMAARFTLWGGDNERALAVAKRLSGSDTNSVLVRAFVGLIMDRKVSTAEMARIRERQTAVMVTKRTRLFWHQLSAELGGAINAPVIPDIQTAVSLGLFDVAWMDMCPLLAGARKDPAFAPLRDIVAARAKATLLQLQGADATIAA
jgi:serine/threonine-protein kinase